MGGEGKGGKVRENLSPQNQILGCTLVVHDVKA